MKTYQGNETDVEFGFDAIHNADPKYIRKAASVGAQFW